MCLNLALLQKLMSLSFFLSLGEDSCHPSLSHFVYEAPLSGIPVIFFNHLVKYLQVFNVHIICKLENMSLLRSLWRQNGCEFVRLYHFKIWLYPELSARILIDFDQIRVWKQGQFSDDFRSVLRLSFPDLILTRPEKRAESVNLGLWICIFHFIGQISILDRYTWPKYCNLIGCFQSQLFWGFSISKLLNIARKNPKTENSQSDCSIFSLSHRRVLLYLLVLLIQLSWLSSSLCKLGLLNIARFD